MESFKVCESAVKVRNTSQNCHYGDYTCCTFMSFCEVKCSPNFFDVPSNLPKTGISNQTFEERKSKQTARWNYRNTDCCLAKVEKIRMTLATSCKDREFSIPCEIATSIVWIVFSPESSDFSWGTKSLELSGIDIRNLESNRPQLDPFTRKYSSPCNSLLRSSLFRNPSLAS